MSLIEIQEKLNQLKKKKANLQQELSMLQKTKKKIIPNIIGTSWWYIANVKSKLWFDGEFVQINLMPQEHRYLSYIENNFDFSQAPKTNLTLTYDEGKCIFEGEVQGNVKAKLYIIEYVEGVKNQTFSVACNETRTFKFNNNNSYRYAIKLKGKGSFKLRNIIIDNQHLDGFEKLPSNVIDLQRRNYTPSEILEKSQFQWTFENNYEYIFDDLKPFNRFHNFCDNANNAIRFNTFSNGYSYFEIVKAPCNEVLSGNCYDIGFLVAGQFDKVSLIVVGYDSQQNVIETREIAHEQMVTIKFKENVSHITYLVKVVGKGEIKQIKIGMTAYPYLPLTTINIDLGAQAWFTNNQKEIFINNTEELLTVKTDKTLQKTNYVSYDLKNLSFAKVPNKFALNIDESLQYVVKIDATTIGNGSAVPILITYTATAKQELLPIALNENNVITFKKGIIGCRIALKLTGDIDIQLENFSINVFEKLQPQGIMEYSDEKEVQFLQLSPPKDLRSVKMAVIFDEFTMQCFANECQVITFTPENWKETLASERPDFLMVESAWRGNNGSWTKKVQYQDEETNKDLVQLIQYCKEHGIPTLFWNKEDPVHFNEFINTAKLFDYVFTTDSNMIEQYKENCNHNRVDYLQFAAQPLIHNPITIGDREQALSFAGSYYAKHIQRSEDMVKIFDAAQPYGLVIFDRNYMKVKQGLLPNNRYPDRFVPNIRGSLKYYEIDKAYKGFKAVININTVTNSPTMFARRVYEALACGTPVISNYSQGVEEIFGDLICTSSDTSKVQQAIGNLFNNKDKYNEIVMEGIRRVLKEHTYTHRLQKIVDTLGLHFKVYGKSILVLAYADNMQDVQTILTTFTNQTYQGAQLCMLVASEEMIDEIGQVASNISIFVEQLFYDTFQSLYEYSDWDYLAIIDAAEVYDPNYLLDLALATKYVDWEVITKQQKQEMVFEQVYSTVPKQSMVKRNMLGLLSTSNLVQELIKRNSLEFLVNKGVRILSVPTIIKN